MLVGCSAASRKAQRLERAERHFKAGQYDEARIDYMAVLRTEPRNVLAIQRLGQIWSEEGAPITAMPFLMKARDLQPDIVEIRKKLLAALVGIAGFEQAKQQATEILQRAPSDSETLFLLTQFAQTPEQLAEMEKQLKQFPATNSVEFHLAAANIALRRNDKPAAEAEIQKSLKVNPKSALAHAALGQYYAATKNLEGAGKELKKAAELAPPRSSIRVQYAEFLFSSGKSSEGKALLAQMTKATPDYLPIYRVSAKVALAQRNYKEALAALQNIFTREPQDLEARFMEAEALIGQHKPKEAVEALEKLNAAYHGKIPGIKLRLAKAALANNDRPRAEKLLDQVIAENPKYADAILARADLSIRSDQASQAVGPLEELLKAQPNLTAAQELLGEAYRATGRFESATKLFHKQISLTNQSALPYFDLGLTKLQENKPDEARQYFEKAAEVEPNNILPVEQLVNLDIAKKDYAAATRRVQQQFQRTPNYAPVYVLEGKIYAAQTDWPKAEAAFKKAVELNGKFDKARQLLISSYLAQGKAPQAVSELEAMLKNDPNDPRARLLLATIFEGQKGFAAARDEYEKLLAANPNFVPALNNLAWLYAEQFNELDKANELAQKASSLQPADGSIADTLGWILYRRGDYQQALSRLQISAGKLPANPAVQYHLGMTLYMMGQLDPARAALQKAVETKDEFPGKAEAKARLALLDQSGGPGSQLSASQLQPLLEQNPNDPLVATRLGEALERENQPAKAAAAYEQALKSSPHLPGPTLKLAWLYAGPLQDRAKAVAYARKAKELSPNDASTAVAVGEIAYRAGNFPLAYSVLQARARAGGKDPAVLHDLAMSAYALGKVSEARQTMQDCLSLSPNESQREDAKKFLTMTALEKPSPQAIAAEPEAEAVLRKQPDSVPALMVKAAIKMQRNQPGEAAAIYSKVLQYYPDFAPAQKRLAAIYAENPNDIEKAHELALKARSSLRDDPELARILARISFQRKEFAYAAQLFEQSEAGQPLTAEDLYYMGIAQLQSKQETKGRETLDRALKAGLSGRAAEEARRQLAANSKSH